MNLTYNPSSVDCISHDNAQALDICGNAPWIVSHFYDHIQITACLSMNKSSIHYSMP